MDIKDFVTYEQAFALAKLGFNEETFTYYDKDDTKLQGLDDPYEYHLLDYNNRYSTSFSAPTLAQVQKWLRKEKGYSIEPISIFDEDNYIWSGYIVFFKEQKLINMDEYKSYEEALSDIINKCIKLLKYV